MDLNKLRTLVFEKTGIKVETSDPIFALVALNEAVFSECVEQHIVLLQRTAEQLKEQTGQLIDAGDRTKNLLLQMGKTVEEPAILTTPGDTKNVLSLVKAPGFPLRRMITAVAMSAFCALLVLGGQAMLGYPGSCSHAAFNPKTTPMLTPEQILLMQNGEKYTKIWAKLDAKTQAKIQALAQ